MTGKRTTFLQLEDEQQNIRRLVFVLQKIILVLPALLTLHHLLYLITPLFLHCSMQLSLTWPYLFFLTNQPTSTMFSQKYQQHTNKYTHAHTFSLSIYLLHKRAHTHTHAHPHIHTAHMHTHIRMHEHHVRTHTHTHMPVSPRIFVKIQMFNQLNLHRNKCVSD